MVSAFAGYNHNLVTNDNTFYDQKNMSTDAYPSVATRSARSVQTIISNSRGVIHKESLLWISGNSVYYNYEKVDNITLNDELPKQIVSMGAYVVIFPDAVYINTENLTDCGNLGAKYDLKSGNGLRVTVCRQDGSEYQNLKVDKNAPQNPSVGDYWIDISSTPRRLKLYTYEEIWSDVPTSYCSINAYGINNLFKAGDGVTITASDSLGGLLQMQSEGVYSSTFVISATINNGIVIPALTESAQTVYPMDTVTFSVERKIPKMDYVIESQNRLWGCYYGVSDSGEPLNEIYASALGDPKNWQTFQGTAADSYTVSLGSDGMFTGAIAYQNRPVFFKENYIHTIYGDYPSNYTLNTTTARGIQRGSWRSAAIVSGILYYKSVVDVCAYDGSLPKSVSAPLGNVPYKYAVAGVLGSKLYITMEDNEGISHLFVYDSGKGLWSKEDNIRIMQFAGDNDSLYMLANDGRLLRIDNTGNATEPIEWSLTTNIQGFEDPDGKRVRQVKLNMLMEENAVGTLEVMYDSSGEWQRICDIRGVGKTKCTSVIFIPQLCDHYQLRLSGEGYMHLVSVAKSTVYGGEKR
jgi:hypothetical protein